MEIFLERIGARRLGAIVIACTVVLLAWMIMGGRQAPWTRTETLYVMFDDVGALRPGASIRHAGLLVGHVEAIRFRRGADADTRFEVELEVLRDTLGLLDERMVGIVTPQGVLGKSLIELVPSPYALQEGPGESLRAGAQLEGVNPQSLDRAIGRLYNNAGLMLAASDELREPWGEFRKAVGGLEQELDAMPTMDARDAVRLWDVGLRVRDYANVVQAPAEQALARWRVLQPGLDGVEKELQRFEALVAKFDLAGWAMRDGKSAFSVKTAALVANVEIAKARVDYLMDAAPQFLQEAQHGTILRLLTDPELYDLVKAFAHRNGHEAWRLIGYPDDQSPDPAAGCRQFGCNAPRTR